jgi:hypothetical protein
MPLRSRFLGQQKTPLRASDRRTQVVYSSVGHVPGTLTAPEAASSIQQSEAAELSGCTSANRA